MIGLFVLGLVAGVILTVLVGWIVLPILNRPKMAPADHTAILPAEIYQSIKEMAVVQGKTPSQIEFDLIVERMDELKEDYKSHDRR